MGKKKRIEKMTIIRLAILGIVLVGGFTTVFLLLNAKEKDLKAAAETAQEVSDASGDSGEISFSIPSTKTKSTEPTDEKDAAFDYDEFYRKGVDYNEISEKITHLTEATASDYDSFTLNGKQYRIGDSTQTFINDGYTLDTVISGVDAHTMIPVPFSLDGEAKFLGFVFNPTNSSCAVEDTLLVKISFFQSADVTIGGKLTFTTEDFENVLGEKAGTFYQSSDVSVWTTGKNVGDPYLLVYYGATDTSIFGVSSRGILEIRIGVWCFEGEYDQCVKEV